MKFTKDWHTTGNNKRQAMDNLRDYIARIGYKYIKFTGMYSNDGYGTWYFRVETE